MAFGFACKIIQIKIRFWNDTNKKSFEMFDKKLPEKSKIYNNRYSYNR